MGRIIARLGAATVAQALAPIQLVVFAEMLCGEALAAFERGEERILRLPVITREGRFLGIVYRRDLETAAPGLPVAACARRHEPGLGSVGRRSA